MSQQFSCGQCGLQWVDDEGDNGAICPGCGANQAELARERTVAEMMAENSARQRISGEVWREIEEATPEYILELASEYWYDAPRLNRSQFRRELAERMIARRLRMWGWWVWPGWRDGT